MKIVFVDRDDTLIRCRDLPPEAWASGHRGDLSDPARVSPIPGVLDACLKLFQTGYRVIVVTNQGMVARGHGTLDGVTRVNTALRRFYASSCSDPDVSYPASDSLIGVWSCPFHPRGQVGSFTTEHTWRKPLGGMIKAAAHEYGLSLAGAWMIGDAARDLEAGIAAGIPAARCLRVGPGFPSFGEWVEHVLSTDVRDAGGAACTADTLDPGERSRRAPEHPHDLVRGPDVAASGKTFDPSGSAAPDPTGVEVIQPASTGVLRAARGEPLDDPDVRETVIAAAHAIAERTGVRVIHLEATASEVRAVLETHRLAAMGFMSELRRATNAWYGARHDGATLWIGPA